MNKELQEIEDKLRESRLPDTDFSKSRYETWHRLIKAQRERRKPKTFSFLNNWVWTFASLIIIALGIIIMYYLSSL
ncbi:MAG: hypothetical protein DWQ05_06975 [Calditrichaeota bacterium]|nr:MAG: hypothetical protein DWQ05_06975 [Calditrichota bacterium]